MEKPKAHVSEKKKRIVEELKKLIQQYKLFGIVDLTNMPSPQLQKIKSLLKGTAIIKVAKKRLIKLALDQLKEVKKGIEKMEEYVSGISALIFTNENPFKLYRVIEKNKTMTSAKPGQIAPSDIYIQAGPTPFTPGPIIGELGQFGIKTGVEEGKVVIKEDKLLVKEGEVIDAKMAELLSKLGIEPMEIGLNLKVVYDNGTIYKKDILAISEEEYYENFKKVAKQAINLALNIKYFTSYTTKMFIVDAARKAFLLAESRSIITKETIKNILAKAKINAEHLKNKLGLEGG